jgi:streptomycin 6-kinase
MFILSEAFRRRVASVWGAKGEAWLERLPALIEACAERWTLSVRAPARDLSYNFVTFVVTADGTEAVLKIGVPNPELTAEIDALRAYAGGPVVELLAADCELGALLIRRLIPGMPLSEAEEDEEATVIAGRLMRDLPVAEPPDHRFPTVGDWALAFDRISTTFDGATGPLPEWMVDKAAGLFRELRASTSCRKLLHGDLHHENILADRANGWVAIDPKGVIGDSAYEAARFQHNPIPGFLSTDDPRAVARRRVEILASILGEDRVRLLAWAFFDAVLAACWSVEEETDWTYHLACAELLDRMIE